MANKIDIVLIVVFSSIMPFTFSVILSTRCYAQYIYSLWNTLGLVLKMMLVHQIPMNIPHIFLKQLKIK